jgi:hypothetical protein
VFTPGKPGLIFEGQGQEPALERRARRVWQVPALLENIRPGWKGLPEVNTLAYYVSSSVGIFDPFQASSCLTRKYSNSPRKNNPHRREKRSSLFVGEEEMKF